MQPRLPQYIALAGFWRIVELRDKYLDEADISAACSISRRMLHMYIDYYPFIQSKDFEGKH